MKESKITPGERSRQSLLWSAGCMAVFMGMFIMYSDSFTNHRRIVFLGIQSMIGAGILIKYMRSGGGWKIAYSAKDFEIHDRREMRESGALAELRLFREDARGYILATRKGDVYRLLRKDTDTDLQLILGYLEKVA